MKTTSDIEMEAMDSSIQQGPGPAEASPGAARRQAAAMLGRVGVPALFVIMIIVFSVLKPDAFPTTENLKAILLQASVFAVLGAGLTVILVIHEFDLSFDVIAVTSGAAAVSLMSVHQAPTVVAIAAALGVGLVVGAVCGALVAYGRAPAIIATLAVASVVGGIQEWFTDGDTLFGVNDSYLALGTDSIVGIPLFVIVSIGCVAAVWVLLKKTVYGRHAHAVGANPVAAESAGIRTARVRFIGFIVLGGLAGLAGILMTAQAGGHTPGSEGGLLLPAYTAAFLGTSALATGGFSAPATYFGVLFIGTLSTGMTMLQAPSWVATLVTGLVLIAVVLLRRRSR